MSEYPFLCLAQNRDCFGEAGVKVSPCLDFPCIHTACHDPDYLTDREDVLRDAAYHNRLWWEFQQSQPCTSDRFLPNPPGDKTRELERLLDKLYILSTEKAEGQAKAFIHTITRPLSEGERKDFESKLPRCQRLLEKSKDLHRNMHPFSIKREIKRFKSLNPNQDSRMFRDVCAYRDEIGRTSQLDRTKLRNRGEEVGGY